MENKNKEKGAPVPKGNGEEKEWDRFWTSEYYAFEGAE